MIAATRPEMSVNEAAWSVAFELGKKDWKLAMTSGFGVDPWVRSVPSGDLRAVERVLREGRRRLAVPTGAPVMSCYEAGRDGFWIDRALTQMGVRNRVVDSASIEVNRRARRVKTDRLDALTRQQATEWAKHGVTVNAISPTFVDTPQVASLLGDPDFKARIVSRIPLGRVGTTDDLLGAVLLFSSAASSFITGQILTIDGGLTATQ